MIDSTVIYPLCIQQGATYSRIFTWLQDGSCGCGLPVGANGPLPVNLTGYSASMQIRPYALSTTIFYDASSDIVLGGLFGTITLTIDATDTEGFTWWQGVYDLLMTSAGGQVTRLLSGTVTISPGVTT
jgi:hypothetical protein